MHTVKIIRKEKLGPCEWEEISRSLAKHTSGKRFFETALAELKRYSSEREFPEWETPPVHRHEDEDHWYAGFYLPGLHTDRLAFEIRKGILVLHGLRTDYVPREQRPRTLEFRRLLHVPDGVRESSVRALYTDDILFLLFPKNGE